MSSVIQSTPFSVPPGSHETTTGRTSVTRLRNPLGPGIRQSDGIQEASLDQSSTSTSQILDDKDLVVPCPALVPRRSQKSQTVCTSRPSPQVLGAGSKKDDHDGTGPSVRAAGPGSEGRIPTLAHHLDGTPDPPTPPLDPARLKPQRKGRVTELKKAFERGLSDLVRKRRPTESGEGVPGRRPVARRPQPQRHAAAPIDSSSPEDSPSKGSGSLFCAPLPTPFRREPSAPTSPLKDKISIFEGLVKPSSSSSLPPGPQQANRPAKLDGVSFLAGDRILEEESVETTSRLPDKFRGAPARVSGPAATARGTQRQLQTRLQEPAKDSGQLPGEADPPSFLRRLSSTFKHKHKSSRQHFPSSRNSRADRRAEEESTQHSSRESQSTPRIQKQSQSEQRQKLAVESLRKRLESELRSGAPTKGHRESQTDQEAGSKQQHEPLPASQSHEQDEQPSSVEARRKSTLWDIENPFDAPKAKGRSKSDASGGRLDKSDDRYSGHTESNDFSHVALARISSSRDVPRQPSSAAR